MRWSLFALPVAVALAAFAAAGCSQKSTASPPDSPVSATPGSPAVSDDSLLHQARLDASGSRRLNVEPLQVELVSLRQAGWDGCLGAASPGQACNEIFVAGYIAVFSGGGREARYHFGMGRFVGPVDPGKQTVSDGSPVPPQMRTDFNALLALYARHELALRLKVDVSQIATAAIVPVTFPNGCLGWPRPGAGLCTSVVAPGAIVLFDAPGGKSYRYHVSDHGIIATDFAPGRAMLDPDPKLVDVQDRMREDLARRTGVAAAKVSVRSYRQATWPDGCMGVSRPGAVCTQALVPGFLATLTDSSGREYQYHGSGQQFIAADFEQGATITPPLPPKE